MMGTVTLHIALSALMASCCTRQSACWLKLRLQGVSEQGCPISLGSVWEEENRKPRVWATARSQSLRLPCPSVLGPSTDRQPQEWRVDLVSGLRPDTAGATMHAKEAGVDLRRSE